MSSSSNLFTLDFSVNGFFNGFFLDGFFLNGFFFNGFFLDGFFLDGFFLQMSFWVSPLIELRRYFWWIG